MAALAVAAALPVVLQLAPVVTAAIQQIETLFRSKRASAATPADIAAINAAKMTAVVDVVKTAAQHAQEAGIIPAVPDPIAIATQAQQIFNTLKPSLDAAPAPVPQSFSLRLFRITSELTTLAADAMGGG